MPRTKTTLPPPDREKGQRSLDLPDYITRVVPIWQNPGWLAGETWRNVVKSQPVAMICRETLIANITALDWKIEPRDSNKRDELRSEIGYYTQFLSNTGELDYVQIIEWIVQDYLDIPFGAGVEVGREGDSPQGKVLWIEPLDGATLFPTLNSDWPVGQFLKEKPTEFVYFPKHAINRLYMSPRTEIRRKGWGMAPPEKIYLSLELLNRGDRYYANLLLDTPPVGILDLGDMAKDTAEQWLLSWRDLLGGTDQFKIPVLYEHEKTAEFVSFTKSPTELMFDKATSKYTSITTAGYGMSPGDIGLPSMGNGGETLAGTIRQERRTRKTGFGILKKKVKYFMDRVLPPYLEFKFIDLDDELNVAIGRARLASATAWQVLIDRGVFLKNEVRQQMIADGLLTISIPETIEGGDEVVESPTANQNERSGLLGRPIAPSQGGQGEVKASEADRNIYSDLSKIFSPSDAKLRRAIRSILEPSLNEIQKLYSNLYENDLFDYWNDIYDNYLDTGIYADDDEVPQLMLSTIQLNMSALQKSLPIDFEWSDDSKSSLIQIFSDVLRYKEYQKLLKLYEIGKSDVEPDESSVVIDSKTLEFIENEAIALFSSMKSKIVDRFYKTIISGVRRYLTDITNAKKLDDLDIETFMSDNIVSYIKNSLSNQTLLVLNELSGELGKISEKYLEES